MRNLPKVLIGTLFSEVKDYCIRDFFKHVCKFTYPNFDICLVDNSKDKKYHKKLFNFFSEHKKKSNIGKLTVLHAPRVHKKPEVFMAFSANELQKYFFRGEYVWLLNLECDIFPPVDIIERLLSYKYPVIGATYFSGNKKTPYPMIIELSLYPEMGPAINNPNYLKGFYEMTDTFEPKPYFGQGIGCLLLEKPILQQVPFRADPTGKTFYDSIFFYDLLSKNIQNKLVPIMCRHDNQVWEKQFKMISS